MAKVSLRSYNREIEKLIESGQLDEAIAHCRHILKMFSKHLETYRLLGKAYLEAKRYNEAVDIFQRVLVAVPDDFVSHVGMSIISDDQSKLEDALWHMERAFEVQPSNAAIQSELQRLFGRRDGQEPPKIRLTRGALAHMYVQGELYTQAISEIKAVLANDPKRTDMQVLLARAYFSNGQKNEATDICTQLLRQFLYCFDANRVMVDLLPGSQRAESTQVFRHRVSELDPYAAFAQESVFRADDVPDASVNLERFQYTGQVTDSAPGWNELGIVLATDATAVTPAQQPEWLKAASNPAPSASFEAAPKATPVAPTEENIPDFMRQAGWGGSSGQFDESAPVFDNEPDASGAVQGDLPDWVKAMAPSTDAAAPAVSTPSADTSDWLRNLGGEQTSVPSSSSFADDGPAWLKELGEPSAPAPSTHQASSSVPDWLKDLGDQDAATVARPQPPVQNISPVNAVQDVKTIPPPAEEPATPPVSGLGNLGTSSQEQDDAMAWLESLASKHGAKAEELVTDPNARTDVAPSWVDKAKAIGETPMAQPASTSMDETGMWLRNLEDNESKSVTDEIPASAETPDWLSELGPASTEPAAAAHEDVPDWLRGMPSKPEEPVAASQDFSFETSTPSSLPEWLAGLDKDDAPTISRSDLPAWLQGDVAPEIIEPSNPADWHPATPQEPTFAEPITPAQPAASEMDYSYEEPIAFKQPVPKPEKKKSAPRLKQTGLLTPRSIDSLASAQAEMGRGNISTALEVYSKLIRKGKFLEEIIRDLRDALYRYPVEVSIWQALGDAYMRGNRLQEALDAYTKAEELLR